jgi:hypothetical protein
MVYSLRATRSNHFFPAILCPTRPQRLEEPVFEILIGLFILVLAVLPKTKFYNSGAPGTRYGPPIEPSWIPRLLILAAGLAALLDGISRLRHH